MTYRFTFIFFLLAGSCVFAGTGESVSRIGVLAFEGRDQALSRWQLTADYLSGQIPGRRFLVVPLNHQEFEHAINQGRLDFVLTNPAHFARLTVNFGISRIATFIANPRNQPQARFSSVLFSRADSGITGLSDLRGKRLAAVSEGAFGGYQLARDLLLQQGIDSETDLDTQWFGFPHSAVVEAVLAGKADAGTVRSGVLEAMADRGELGLHQVRVLSPRTDDGYPLLHSVALYPEWPFARLPTTSASLSRQVAISLMSMDPSHAAARRSRGAGWTIPLSDTSVHAVLRRLQVPPYAPQAPAFGVLLDRYGHWLLIISVLLLVTLAALWLLARANTRLRTAQGLLQKSQGELEEAVRLRARELDKTRETLDDTREHKENVEQDVLSACDALSTLYELFLREDMQAEQRMAAMVEAVRHQLGTELGLLSRVQQDESFEIRCVCPPSAASFATMSTPLLAGEAHKAIETRSLQQVRGLPEWKYYLACPVYLEGELHCLLEFASPVDDAESGEETGDGSSELAQKLLNLVAQWIGHEIRREERDIAEKDRLMALRGRFSTVTPRELDVLGLLIQGQSNKEIARSLDLSPKTVEMHRASLLRKTEAKSSTELVQLAVSSQLFFRKIGAGAEKMS